MKTHPQGGDASLKPIEILLVEDSPTDRMLAVEALQRSGLLNTLNVVENGTDAMSYLRREGKFAAARRPDLVILDLNLPKKDGREVLAEVKADPRLKYIPVIVLTTSHSDEDLLSAYGHHANGYITKPLDFAHLAEALRTLGGYWFKVVTLPPDTAIERGLREHTSVPPSVRGQLPERVRTLLIESDPVDTSQIQVLLTQSTSPTFELQHVSTLDEAASALRSEPYELVFLALDLAECRGSETYRRCRRLAGSVPIVVLTANEEDPAGFEALREGAEDHLAKRHLRFSAVARAARHVLERNYYREQLRRAQKLETVGRLVAGVAHDFNNLLSIVKGSAEMLRREDNDPATRAELLLGIHDAADRAGVITRQLLTFSRQRPMVPQRIDLNQVVGGFTRLLRRMLGDGIQLELHLAAELPAILADAGMLDQVLLNLAINARDAMPNGGKLRIQTEAVEISETAKEAPGGAYPGYFAKLCVTDTGAGMEAEVLTRIFEPFFTTKAARDGTGLGLSMVQGIVHQHHGWLKAHSHPGVGTTFEVFLPATHWAPPRRTPPSASQSDAPTILFIEEEAKLRQLAAGVLERSGYRVFEASSEAEALSIWRECGRTINLVVTEVSLPEGRNGAELAEALRKGRPELQFIFTSGCTANSAAPDGPLEEGVDFLQKPYLLSHLLNTVEQRLTRLVRD